MSATTSREVRLRARPRGLPTLDDFEIAETPMPEPREGEALVRTIYMSVDPYMRGRMTGVRSYVAPFEVGEPLSGGAVGQVVESRAPELAPGDLVLSQLGWREFAATPARALERIDPGPAPLAAHLGILGMPGFTAWYGMREIGRPRSGETVFVSAASGAVGSLAGQLATRWGARVLGSVGTEDKAAHVRDELGFDGAFCYRTTPPREALAALAPDGIDVYFDNVGGEHLEAALHHLRDFGRIVACGMISRYNDAAPAPGPSNLFLVVTRRLLLQGFIITDHWGRRGEFLAEVAPLVARGELRWRETVAEGIEAAPGALLKLFAGKNLGKMLVRLAPDPTR